ncbi:MAG: DUF3048 domain-containing protein [Coriobacteriia bacterium]
MSTRTVLRIAAVLAAVALIPAAGCKTQEPGVVAQWPDVTSERTVPQPPMPPRWPLTGLDAADASLLERRVVSVKVENSPSARPQWNLQLADVVYESVTEGGITRFNAIFHSQSPKQVGPVRSARLSDVDIVPQYNALFVFSGASSSVNAAIRKTTIENLSEDAGVTYPYWRGSDRPRPHNLYVDIDKAREEGKKRGMPTTQDVKGFAFERLSVEATPTVTEVSIPFSPANRVVWTYDAETGTYLRDNNGSAHIDKGTGEQLRARNVVVIWAKHTVASRDVVGSTTYDIELIGTGRVTVFRDGQRFDGTWEAEAGATPVFRTSEGTQIKLSPGNTWMQVIRNDINITMR